MEEVLEIDGETLTDEEKTETRSRLVRRDGIVFTFGLVG